MKNYIIPYQERFTRVDLFPGKITLKTVDNVGLVVYHQAGSDISDSNIRQHLIGVESHRKFIVQAESIQDALMKFYQLEECRTGTKFKAWEICDSELEPVTEFCHCDHIRVRNSAIACAYYDEPDDFGTMVCVLDGLDEPPEDCPIKKQTAFKKGKVSRIGGVWVKTFEY